MKLYFVTNNPLKIRETLDHFERSDVKARLGVELCVVEGELQEVLHPDIKEIVRQKTLMAYRLLGLPCVVEHSGLYLDAWPGLLGGVGQMVWDAAGDRMCQFLREEDTREATAQSVVGYCDGRHIRVYCGETRGRITQQARGDYKFHWDPIFEPEGSELTYGEMGPVCKQETSPNIRAWDAFLKAEFPVLNPLRIGVEPDIATSRPGWAFRAEIVPPCR